MFPPNWNRKDDDVGSNPVDETMRMEARIMHKGVRVSADRGLTDRQRDQIRSIVLKHIKEHQITHRAISVQIGVGHSTISEVLKDSYRGDSDKILRQLNTWVGDDAGRRSRKTPIGFYETAVFKTLRDAAAYVKRQADTEPQRSVGGDKARIAITYGPSGCGKSEGAKALCIADPNAIYVRVSSSTRGATAFARAIFHAAGWKSRRVNQSYMDALFEKLTLSGRLLVVDEGHELREPALKFIRDLNDICKIPILIVATEMIRDRVERVRRGIGRIMDDQFSRRVCLQYNLLRGTDGKGGSKRPIYSLEEIAAIFKDDEVKLTDDGLEFLCAIACVIGLGMLGTAANIYDKARMHARRRPGKQIDAAILIRASEYVLLQPGDKFDDGGEAIFQQIQSSLDRVQKWTRVAV